MMKTVRSPHAARHAPLRERAAARMLELACADVHEDVCSEKHSCDDVMDTCIPLSSHHVQGVRETCTCMRTCTPTYTSICLIVALQLLLLCF